MQGCCISTYSFLTYTYDLRSKINRKSASILMPCILDMNICEDKLWIIITGLGTCFGGYVAFQQFLLDKKKKAETRTREKTIVIQEISSALFEVKEFRNRFSIFATVHPASSYYPYFKGIRNEAIKRLLQHAAQSDLPNDVIPGFANISTVIDKIIDKQGNWEIRTESGEYGQLLEMVKLIDDLIPEVESWLIRTKRNSGNLSP